MFRCVCQAIAAIVFVVPTYRLVDHEVIFSQHVNWQWACARAYILSNDSLNNIHSKIVLAMHIIGKRCQHSQFIDKLFHSIRFDCWSRAVSFCIPFFYYYNVMSNYSHYRSLALQSVHKSGQSVQRTTTTTTFKTHHKYLVQVVVSFLCSCWSVKPICTRRRSHLYRDRECDFHLC